MAPTLLSCGPRGVVPPSLRRSHTACPRRLRGSTLRRRSISSGPLCIAGTGPFPRQSSASWQGTWRGCRGGSTPSAGRPFLLPCSVGLSTSLGGRGVAVAQLWRSHLGNPGVKAVTAAVTKAATRLGSFCPPRWACWHLLLGLDLFAESFLLSPSSYHRLAPLCHLDFLFPSRV